MAQHALNTTQLSACATSNAVQNRHETWFLCNFIAETPLCLPPVPLILYDD